MADPSAPLRKSEVEALLRAVERAGAAEDAHAEVHALRAAVSAPLRRLLGAAAPAPGDADWTTLIEAASRVGRWPTARRDALAATEPAVAIAALDALVQQLNERRTL